MKNHNDISVRFSDDFRMARVISTSLEPGTAWTKYGLEQLAKQIKDIADTMVPAN